MQANDDILSLLQQKTEQMAKQTQRGLILQPGAIGDCILTLPLVEFMKQYLDLGSVDILGHTDYIGFMPGRTSVDAVRSMESIELHKLFTSEKTFDLSDGDPLITIFSDYLWIVTFMGEPDSDFERNLIFTANCSRSSEVISLYLKPPDKYKRHLKDFYFEQLINQTNLNLNPDSLTHSSTLIKPTNSDKIQGTSIIEEAGANLAYGIIIIHPGSGSVEKSWHLDNYCSIADKLRSKNIETIFLLGPAESQRYTSTDIMQMRQVGRILTDLSIIQVVQALTCTDAFIGNDSGIAHIAAGMGIKTYTLFGPTDPDVYKPIGPNTTIINDSSRTFARKPSKTTQQQLLDSLNL